MYNVNNKTNIPLSFIYSTCDEHCVTPPGIIGWHSRYVGVCINMNYEEHCSMLVDNISTL